MLNRKLKSLHILQSQCFMIASFIGIYKAYYFCGKESGLLKKIFFLLLRLKLS